MPPAFPGISVFPPLFCARMTAATGPMCTKETSPSTRSPVTGLASMSPAPLRTTCSPVRGPRHPALPTPQLVDLSPDGFATATAEPQSRTEYRTPLQSGEHRRSSTIPIPNPRKGQPPERINSATMFHKEPIPAHPPRPSALCSGESDQSSHGTLFPTAFLINISWLLLTTCPLRAAVLGQESGKCLPQFLGGRLCKDHRYRTFPLQVSANGTESSSIAGLEFEPVG